MTSAVRTRAACLAASEREARQAWVYAFTGRTEANRAARRLASLSPERRAELMAEWEIDE